MHRELLIPPAAVRAERAVEIIRVWLAEKKVHCVLNIGFWEERGIDERDCWGVLLADIMHHIANAHKTEYGRDPQETLNRIRETFQRELKTPTSDRRGEFLVQKSEESGDVE
jgi:hypothetical protein